MGSFLESKRTSIPCFVSPPASDSSASTPKPTSEDSSYEIVMWPFAIHATPLRMPRSRYRSDNNARPHNTERDGEQPRENNQQNPAFKVNERKETLDYEQG